MYINPDFVTSLTYSLTLLCGKVVSMICLFPFDLCTQWYLLSNYKHDTDILLLISNVYLAEAILMSPWQSLDMFCLKWTFLRISCFSLCLQCNIALRKPFLKKKSTILCISWITWYKNVISLWSLSALFVMIIGIL